MTEKKNKVTTGYYFWKQILYKSLNIVIHRANYQAFDPRPNLITGLFLLNIQFQSVENSFNFLIPLVNLFIIQYLLHHDQRKVEQFSFIQHLIDIVTDERKRLFD